MSVLTAFQEDVARLFFGLPASEGFLLARGGALLASGLTTRPTRDLDFFATPMVVDVTQACKQFEAAVTDEEIPIDSSLVARVREFFESWSHDLPPTNSQ